MGSTSSSWVTLSKLHFHGLTSRNSNQNSSPIPFSKTHLPKMLKKSTPTPSRYRLNLSLNASLDNSNALILNEKILQAEVQTSMWKWQDYSIRYQYSGNSGPALVLVHGFGANRLVEKLPYQTPFRKCPHPQTALTVLPYLNISSDHWRKNISVLGKSYRVFSIDLIGYGYSDKPNPREFGISPFYTFETWATQLNDFCTDVVKGKAFFICNSIGGLVGLQAAVMEPGICRGIVLLNISLRMLHIKKQPWNTDVGKFFFKSVATRQSVRSILCQCYHDTSQVTEELVEKILLPGLEPGAVDVFLEFICYSGGPLPEELLPQVKCPVLVGWGDKDPWEPIELGRNYGKFPAVEDFVVLPNVGHCPQDEAPQLVNPLVEKFVARHTSVKVADSITNT
ncbi:hypothetical protein GIB67_023148 [Kingdonia uniflora]|uniref:AB hydrolase-1 domain-containing protein n=1 Tax=Kingdonia uniflora TaxID=39325 RepID=A0A7J7M5Q1_9MAGN|nr:hypothetical protein GIB67_023148 [Kingdonia uniflora]